ncbi:MAG: dephospho-CoA kinase [Armatimonadetes bacterium CG2_30_59_28]|nr:dephospho-CoA kinase [Armatimonadota bacterium]OIO91236.1 MAG: dephospho-CoA kinase [Armatimonadetes bacterium CG2_30_59_28]PIU60405.1 MAG: dephospho-CoA kinase [Armatimonadetes bacterium CG07_land_8_20_14_0_80_59_28]PIX41781.1 MAG: dephospho-CoA kinase [Armatimonadetes bacterium CG_4_8_14_3_um_filter_58_9]PIY49401.1 MAG: dephospho-CoA kinase [Armatimonadetes bacterium CG_4_10_14_3_um_filter_59_10]PJB68173.1 MAG: dephospho-CoA kinase [Armatimonadetes bacterium CG_4_9_14_3_um_filter_58_7]
MEPFPKRVHVVGLTGGAGTGKSTVAGYLKEMGAAVIEADDVARRIVRRGEPLLDKIIGEFGSEFLTGEGELHRGKLADMIFASAEARAKINSLTHPLMIEEIHAEINAHQSRNPQPKAVLIVAAILYEMGLDHCADAVIALVADRATKLARLCERGIPRERAMKMIDIQTPDALLCRRAQVVVHTDLPLSETRRQMEGIWEKLLVNQP